MTSAIAQLAAQGHGDHHIARELGITRHAVRKALLELARAGTPSITSDQALPHHPLAELFPLIEGAEFDALVASIKVNGLRDPIIVTGGLVLDGRNRQRACFAADVPCRYEMLPAGQNALQFVIDKNLKRRHLNESQRAYVAAKLANLGEGRPEKTASIEAVSQDAAAAMLNVSRASVQRAKEVQEKATPELQRAVERGALPVSAAAKAATLEPEKQRRIAEDAEAGRTNAARTVIKQEIRAGREHDLAQKITALPQQKFGVILADPEWRFEPWSRETGLDRAADNHYPTSCTEVIASRDVTSIAADDCVLFLWATVPMLPQALLVMGAWGFDYKSQMVWVKDRVGTGYWFRNQHEILLVGVKGKPPAPAPGDQWSTVLEAPVLAHSAKPESVAGMIEQYFPTLPKIELNRRGPARPGWKCWGPESEAA